MARRTSPLEHSVLSTIAEDRELASRYGDPSEVTEAMVRDVVSHTNRKLDAAIRAISKAQIVSLCFVVDTTGSMASHIEAVKRHTVEIVHQVRSSGCKVAGLSFVGYKDWCDGPSHFEVLDFGGSIPDFEKFVGRIHATGGGDAPEDVVGGLYKAIGLNWPRESGCRVLFHIGDAPPHGRNGGGGEHYHNHLDSFPDGHSEDVPLDRLFTEIRRQELQYYFGRINRECDTMLDIFSRHLGQKIDVHDVSNPGSMAASVTASIMDSVSRSSSTSHESRPVRLPPMDKHVPKWGMLPVLNATLLTYALPKSMSEITSMDAFDQTVVRGYVQVAPKPFANGTVRLAYYARRLFTDGDHRVTDVPRTVDTTFHAVDEIVLKDYIKPREIESLTRSRFMVDLETQTVAAKLAFDFNEKLSRTSRAPNLKLKYLMSKLARIENPDGSFRFMAMEKLFRGDVTMVKYTNNYSFVRVGDAHDEDFHERSALAVAFSHFTYEYSNKYLMVTDLQGVDYTDNRDRQVMLLTDPAIHCPHALRFGSTNLRQKAIDAFFKVHTCNKFCEALGLKDRSRSRE